MSPALRWLSWAILYLSSLPVLTLLLLFSCVILFRLLCLSPKLAVTPAKVGTYHTDFHSCSPSIHLGTQWGLMARLLSYFLSVNTSLWRDWVQISFNTTIRVLVQWVGSTGVSGLSLRIHVRTWPLLAVVLFLPENWFYLPTIRMGFCQVGAAWCSGITSLTIWTKRKERTSLSRGHLWIPREDSDWLE